MKHLSLKPSQRLQLDGSTILANKTEQMPQQYQMNGKSKSNLASMNDNKSEMKTKQPFGKKRSGLCAKNGNYVEIEEKPEPTPNRFELFGLRPIKKQMPLPSKPKQNQKLLKATKSIEKATRKRNWTDNNILAGRRWSMKNPLDHLLKEQQKQQKKTSTKMAKPKPNKKENVEEKQQNEENSGELTNKEEEGIIEKGQRVEPIIKKKRGRPPKGIATTNKKKETKQKKRGRKPKNTGMLNKEEDGIIEKGQPAEPIIKKRGRPKGSGVKRNYFTWEPVTEEEASEPVIKKTRTRGAKKYEEKVVEEKLVEAEQLLELEPEPNQQQIEQEEEETNEDLPSLPFSGHPSSPPTPPQSSSTTSSSTSTPNSATTTNPNELSPEVAKVLEFKQRLLKVDDRGYLKCPNNSLINKRFDVDKPLGDGKFSNVYLVRDWRDGVKKAIKIIRNTPEYMAAAEEEIEMLNYLDKVDPEKKEQFVIRKLETLRVEQFGHHCILFPMYGKDVNTFMKANKYHPFPLDQIRYMAYQLIHATNFLHKNHVIHTDLKPENILFVHDKFATKTAKKIKILRDATIRLCDIGNAVFAGRPQKDKCVSTSHYRAPEAILETGFGHPCDVWSLGCIIFELYAGHFLIPKVSNLTHLQMLERILGTTNELPQWMREQTKKPGLFDSRLKLLNRKQPQEERDSNCKIEDAKPLKSYIYAGHEDDPDHKALFDLIAQMLNHDPNMRVKLATSQSHEFFNSLEPALRAKVDRGGWDEDKKQSRKQRNKIYPSKVKQNGQQQSGIIAENFDADGNGGGAGPSHK